MSLPETVFYAVVLCVGVPAMVKNVTAVGLVFAWLAGQLAWLATGDNLPLNTYVLADLAVVALICCKPEVRSCFPYRNSWHQLCALWIERGNWDRAILLIFGAMWAVYLLPLSDYHKWWSLWWLALAQFVLAGGEAYQTWRRDRAANAPDASEESPFSEFAWGWADGT